MSRFDTKDELLTDARTARAKLEALLERIPPDAKATEVVIDDLTTKDLIAHRTEWGRMMLGWYAAATDGGIPAVPAEGYTWRQLPELNAEIRSRFADDDLGDVEAAFASVHDELDRTIAACSEEELFTKRYYSFTGSSDLATYFTSATGGHYRSAYKHINRWWRAR